MSNVKTYREALNEALHEEMERDPTVIVLGEDVAGGFDRVIDTPISESAIMGAGAHDLSLIHI